MTCDGSPGNPGVETVPSEDGVEKYACTGCSVCRTTLHQTMEAFHEAMDVDPTLPTGQAVKDQMDAMVLLFNEAAKIWSEQIKAVAETFMPPKTNRAMRRARKFNNGRIKTRREF